MASAVSSTSVKWITSDHDGLPMKRKQVAQACTNCRKRKKRCIHAIDPDSRPARKLSLADGPDRRPDSPDSQTSHTSQNCTVDDENATQVAANRLIELSSSRFISDLNPEGMFIEAATPALPKSGTTYRDKNDLGVWLPPLAQTHRDGGPHRDGDTVNSGGARTAPSHPPSPQQRRGSRYSGSRSMLSEAATRYERAKYTFVKECLTLYPPDVDFAVLHRIYCERIHPMFPVLKDADLRRALPRTASTLHAAELTTTTEATENRNAPTPSPVSPAFATVVKQVMALSAALVDAEASAPHMRLEADGPLLTPREFHQRLTDAVSMILDADIITYRFDYIRIAILLSFFYQPSTEVDRNKPSLLITQATHHFQTIGAHLLGFRPERPDDDIDCTFCTLWALDRLSSLLYARPCMMHSIDNGKNPEDCMAKQPPCFRLFMSVMLWLDKVIHLYRPRQPFVMIDIPVYESLILDAHAEKLPNMLLGSIEVLYHTVCVLSCRQPFSAFTDVTPDNRDSRNYLPISIMNPRRSHSADRIVWVTHTQPIVLFPFVPYAVSIALSVQYKKMRYSRTSLFRTRARAVFKDIVALLKSMGDVFVNARVSAALGESIWKQMEKTATTLAREELESGGAQQNGINGSGGSSVHRTSAYIAASSSAASASATNISANNQSFGAGASQEVSVSDTGLACGIRRPASQVNGTKSAVVGASLLAANEVAAVVAPSLPPASSQVDVDATTTSFQQPQHQQQQGSALLDLSVLDTLDMDIDLFGNFDPSFDLGAIDTALEANLDMAIPQTWTPWNSLS